MTLEIAKIVKKFFVPSQCHDIPAEARNANRARAAGLPGAINPIARTKPPDSVLVMGRQYIEYGKFD